MSCFFSSSLISSSLRPSRALNCNLQVFSSEWTLNCSVWSCLMRSMISGAISVGPSNMAIASLISSLRSSATPGVLVRAPACFLAFLVVFGKAFYWVVGSPSTPDLQSGSDVRLLFWRWTSELIRLTNGEVPCLFILGSGLRESFFARS